MPDDESLTLKSFRRTPRLAHPIARKFHGHLPCFLVILARVRAQAAASLVRLQGYWSRLGRLRYGARAAPARKPGS